MRRWAYLCCLIVSGLIAGVAPAETEKLDHQQLVQSCTAVFHGKASTQVAQSLEASLKEIEKVISLEAAQKEKFRGAIAKIAEEVSTGASKTMAGYFEPMEDERLAAYLRAAQGRPLDRDPRRVEGARLLATLDHPKEWETALGDILSADQKQHWDSEVKKRRDQARDQEIEEFMRPRRWRVQGQVAQRLTTNLTQTRAILGLADVRYKALKSLSDQIADKIADAWTLKESNWLRALPENSRTSYVYTQSGGEDGYVGYDSDAVDTAWKEALATQISGDEAKRYEESLSQLPLKRARCFARLFIADKDPDIYLTASQREKLEPAVIEAFQSTSWTATVSAEGALVDLMSLYNQGHKTHSEIVSQVLDETQRERWDRKLLSGVDLQRSVYNGDNSFRWREVAVQMSIPQVLARFLREQYALRGATLKKSMHLKIMDLGHLLALNQQELRTLEIAGLGAVERSLETYTENSRTSAEAILEGAQPDEVAPRLTSLLAVGVVPPAPETQGVWRRALEAHLSPEQVALWNKEVDERTAYDEQAVVDLILLDLTTKYGLSEAQEQRLAPLILKSMHTLNEIHPLRRHWYFSAVERLLPILSIEEPALQRIFTEDQWREFDGRDGNALRRFLQKPQPRPVGILGP